MRKKIKFGICAGCYSTPVQELDTEEKTITAKCKRCGTIRVDRTYIDRYGIPEIFTGGEN